MKKIFSLVLCGLVAVSLVTGCNEKKEENKKSGSVSNTSNTSIKNTIVAGLDIVDFAIRFENNISEVYLTIENNTNETKTYEKLECIMYDKDKNVLDSFIYNMEPIEASKAIDVVYKVDKDLTKVASVEYAIQ